MKTLIVFATKYGATRRCAQAICDGLQGDASLFNLSESVASPDLRGFDSVIAGTPVYIGRARKEFSRFLRSNEKELLTRPLGLFLCCMQDVSQSVADQVRVVFPASLREHACAIGALGGIVDFRTLRGMDKLLMQLIAGDLRKKSGGDVVTTLSNERITAFIQAFESGLK